MKFSLYPLEELPLGIKKFVWEPRKELPLRRLLALRKGIPSREGILQRPTKNLPTQKIEFLIGLDQVFLCGRGKHGFPPALGALHSTCRKICARLLIEDK